MSDILQVITSPAVGEKTTCRLTLQLTDETGANIPGSQITKLTLTLFAVGSNRAINGCRDVDILNNGGRGVLDTDGELTITLGHADNVIVYPDRPMEYHAVRLAWRWAAGAKRGKKEIHFPVANLTRIV